MSRIAYVNGAYRPLSEAGVSVEDRGFQFADAIYEVWAVREGRLLDLSGHLARLRRSLGDLRIAWTMSDSALLAVLRETIRRNRVSNGIVYLQVSRGAAPRDHVFPPPGTKPTIVVTARTLDRATLQARGEKGVAVITAPDERWARCDIKSVNLLPNLLARQRAREAGAFEAWLLDGEGVITEGTTSTAWIVDTEGRLRTAPLSNRILHGVTRAVLLALARERQIPFLEQAFTPADVRAAREAFLTAASNSAVPVVAIDGAQIGDGKPGPITRRLRDAYFGAQAIPT